MYCKSCNAQLDDLDSLDLRAEVAAHDDDVIEVKFDCQECDKTHYAFLNVQDFCVAE